MDTTCSNGIPLFSEDNATLEVIQSLRRFRAAYEPYHGYLCTVICSFGILTNLINVVVLTKRQMRTSINVLLTGIAFCDMGTMASYLIYIVHFVLADHQCNPNLYTYGWMFFLMCHVMLSIALHTTTLWLSVAMAFIRNMTLRQVRVGSPWLRSDNTWKICVTVYACVFSLSVPNVFSNGILPWPEYFNHTCSDKSNDVVAEMESQYKAYTVGVPPEHCVVYTITFWLTGTLFKILPCVLLALLIFSLLFTIKRAEKNRKALLDKNRNGAILNLTTVALGNPTKQNQTSPNSGRSDRTTTMLLMILGLSLLTELPQGAISILSGIYVSHMQEHVYPNVADMLDLLSLINSSVNFILYTIMSSKYRQVFWQVVLPRKLYVRWFVRHRPSERNRLRHNRRQPSPPLLSGSGFHPESSSSLVTKLMKRKNRRRPTENENSLIEDEFVENFTDIATPPVTKSRTSVFSFTIDPESGKERFTFTPRPSVNRLGSFLDSKSSRDQTTMHMVHKSAHGTLFTSWRKKQLMQHQSRTTLVQKQISSTTTFDPADKHDFLEKQPSCPFRFFRKSTSKDQTDLKNMRKQWLIDCLCLCKCSCRNSVESGTTGTTKVENANSKSQVDLAKETDAAIGDNRSVCKLVAPVQNVIDSKANVQL